MSGTGRRWHGHAFGLGLKSTFELAGCAQRRLDGTLAEVALELGPRASLHGEHARPGAPELTRDRDGGYVFESSDFGHFQVSQSGDRIRCAPAPIESWRWQRYLTGRVLPFTSTLRGLEPWHASAVSLRDGAIALAGASGRGKSTLAAELVLRGARLLADDVLALEHADGGVKAHPGPGLMSLRAATVKRLDRAELGRLGRRVGADAEGLRLAVPRNGDPAPLSTVYLLKGARAGQPVRIALVPHPDPRLLLASTFSFAPLDPERLTTQLDVCAAIARSVRVVRVELPSHADYRALAERLLSDLQCCSDEARGAS